MKTIGGKAAVVGRFLSPSPDPFVQDPSFSQSYYRYSYCLNNPLKFTDYSGESWKSFWNKIGNWMTRNNIKFQVGYNSTFGPGFSIGDNPMYYPGWEKKIVDGQRNISNQLAGFSSMGSYTMPELSLPTEGFVGESPLANGVASSDGGTPWYSKYNWPALGSSARTMDALYAGDYLSATGYFLTCAAEVFTLGYSSGIKISSQVVTTTAKTSSQGFKSFSSFKRAMGSAGEGQAWHHIVEKNPANIAKFGPESIHNTGNMMKLPHGAGSIHVKVTGHYNSLMPGTSMRVRNYVNTLDYQQQYQYGLDVLKRFGY